MQFSGSVPSVFPTAALLGPTSLAAAAATACFLSLACELLGAGGSMHSMRMLAIWLQLQHEATSRGDGAEAVVRDAKDWGPAPRKLKRLTRWLVLGCRPSSGGPHRIAATSSSTASKHADGPPPLVSELFPITKQALESWAGVFALRPTSRKRPARRQVR